MKIPKNVENGVLAIGQDVAYLDFFGDVIVGVLDLVVKVTRYELCHGFKRFDVVDLLFEVLIRHDRRLLEPPDLLHLLETLLHLDRV